MNDRWLERWGGAMMVGVAFGALTIAVVSGCDDEAKPESVAADPCVEIRTVAKFDLYRCKFEDAVCYATSAYRRGGGLSCNFGSYPLSLRKGQTAPEPTPEPQR